jgi:riboflavin kinase/FMN adenylyltransferase
MIGDWESHGPLTGHATRHDHDCLSLSASVVTIGTFDGVHLGHQALLTEIVRQARQEGVPSVVYTFDPPPKTVFGEKLQLTPADEKVRRISHFGIDHIIVARFDKTYAARPPKTFIDELARLSPTQIWVGADFRFGSGRIGDVEMLARNFDTRVIDEIDCEDGDRISSTRLRDLLQDGRSEDARALHGWPAKGVLPGTID